MLEIVQTFDEQAFEPGGLAGRDDEGEASTMSTIAIDRAPVFPLTSTRTPRTARPTSPTARPVRTTGLRLTARGRVVLTLVALVVALGATLSGQRAEAGAPAPALPVQTHTVVAGETLWSVAGSIAAPGQDVRDVVDTLTELNGLSGSTIEAGQLLLVPAVD